MTGGAGFIGTSVSRLIAERAERWVVVDNLHPQVHPEPVRPASLAGSAELVVADVARAATWDELLAHVRPDTVIHLAAETGTGQSLHQATRHAEVNVVGTTAMLDGFSRVGHVPAHFVFSGSRAVYGEGEWQRADGSTFRPGQRSHAQLVSGQWDFPGAVSLPSAAARTWPSPTSIYGATKLAQEQILAAWSGAHGSKLSVLRFQNVYGAGQSLSNPYTGIVSLFSQLARRGESIPVYEDGLITRDFVYIHDVAAAVAAVTVNPPEAPASCFDIGSGVATTILELARKLAEYHGAPAPHITGAFRDGDVRHASCDIDDSLAALDWRPEWSLDRGIADLQEWIEQTL
ncbi:NAD-dependent epimerase/dehydratase family protein [Agromyces sp. G08B096]|uniref:NAD-dependent epimerase/dehydratase family protein n=1 Tax=Agromyces sp. G08B096 TaxID=3156399 RepID=A0AAU7W779_9MICO